MRAGELRAYAASLGVTSLGWFAARAFPAYVQAVSERPEYDFAYRTRAQFVDAATCPGDVTTVIVIAVDYFYENQYPAGYKLSNYSRFCWNTVNKKRDLLLGFLHAHGCLARNLDLPARAAASRAGLGAIGKNCMFYAKGTGSYVGIAMIGTDVALPAETEYGEQIASPACTHCRRCIEACPAQAIAPDGYRIDPLRCLSFLNRHAEEPAVRIPNNAVVLDRWLHGCEVCQDVCPINAKAQHAKDVVIASPISLYGMAIENRSVVTPADLRRRMVEIKTPGFHSYVARLLRSGSNARPGADSGAKL